ncbi:MAG: cytochrome c oxidase subunit II transmembrane domain-containing protein, partial [Bacteroidota bacterium]
MNNRKLGLGVIALSVLAIIGMGVLWAVYGWMPAQKANLAPVIDGPFYFVKWASAALTLGVVLAMLYLMVKYTRKSETQRSEVVIPNTIMETAWIVLPTILVLVVFTWGFKAYVTSNVAPPGAYEIYVKGKKWLWEFTYPNGVVTNELTVPANRPVKLIMTSDDVLH